MLALKCRNSITLVSVDCWSKVSKVKWIVAHLDRPSCLSRLCFTLDLSKNHLRVSSIAIVVFQLAHDLLQIRISILLRDRLIEHADMSRHRSRRAAHAVMTVRMLPWIRHGWLLASTLHSHEIKWVLTRQILRAWAGWLVMCVTCLAFRTASATKEWIAPSVACSLVLTGWVPVRRVLVGKHGLRLIFARRLGCQSTERILSWKSRLSWRD